MTRCLECNKPLKQKRMGRPRLRCPGACTKAPVNARRREGQPGARHSLHCPVCGKLMRRLLRD